MGTYDTIFPQPLGQDKSVIFEVQAANDAHLGFFSSARSTDEVYEIVLSGWGNTQSVVRPPLPHAIAAPLQPGDGTA